MILISASEGAGKHRGRVCHQNPYKRPSFLHGLGEMCRISLKHRSLNTFIPHHLFLFHIVEVISRHVNSSLFINYIYIWVSEIAISSKILWQRTERFSECLGWNNGSFMRPNNSPVSRCYYYPHFSDMEGKAQWS